MTTEKPFGFREMLEIYKRNNMSVHVVLKELTAQGKNIWKNGEIKEVYKDFFMLNEKEEGSMPIWFAQIENLKIYRNKLKEKKDTEVGNGTTN